MYGAKAGSEASCGTGNPVDDRELRPVTAPTGMPRPLTGSLFRPAIPTAGFHAPIDLDIAGQDRDGVLAVMATDRLRLDRPHRGIDMGVVGVGVVLLAVGLLMGNAGFSYAGVLGLLLGSSSTVVLGGLERFTGDALGAGEDIDEDTGWLIGKLENVLVFVFVIVGAWTALSIVFAAKSIVRREDISSGKTTYYLAGTLLNFTYAIGAGLVARWIVGRGVLPVS